MGACVAIWTPVTQAPLAVEQPAQPAAIVSQSVADLEEQPNRRAPMGDNQFVDYPHQDSFLTQIAQLRMKLSVSMAGIV